MEETLKTVTMVLAICSAITPVIFGFVLWKMSLLFVSKTDWAAAKAEQEKQINRIEGEIAKVENKINETLNRINEKLDKLSEKIFAK